MLKEAREKARDAKRKKQGAAGWAQVEGEEINVDAAMIEVERAEVAMSVVVPAFNEEERLGRMLGEAVGVLEGVYGDGEKDDGDGDGEGGFERVEMREGGGGVVRRKVGVPPSSADGDGEGNGHAREGVDQKVKGWEILVVSDGSTDKTVKTALGFAKELPREQRGRIRVVQLGENRGKGGAVTHGMRHVRGQYVVFADADGASRFEDLGTLVQRCQDIEDAQGRGVAVGSRAHLVGSEAVVKVCLVLSSPCENATPHLSVHADIHDSSVRSSATCSCTLSTSSSASSLHPRQLQFATPNAASSCSRALPYPI